MTTAPEDPGMMTNQEAQLLVAITELRTQVTTFIKMMEGQSSAISTLHTSHAALDNRVTVLETQKRGAPTTSSVIGLLGGLVAILGFVIFVLDRFYLP